MPSLPGGMAGNLLPADKHDTSSALRPSPEAACLSRRSAQEVLRQMQKLYNLFIREDGQTMAEYGVVLAVITIAVFGALALLAGNITNALTRVAGYIT